MLEVVHFFLGVEETGGDGIAEQGVAVFFKRGYFGGVQGLAVVLFFLQGLAACGGVVLARTMVRDLAERDQAARAMSLMMACTSIAPMLAPLIGGQILWFLGWRAIFWVLAAIGVMALVAAITIVGLLVPMPAPSPRSAAISWLVTPLLLAALGVWLEKKSPGATDVSK